MKPGKGGQLVNTIIIDGHIPVVTKEFPKAKKPVGLFFFK